MEALADSYLAPAAPTALGDPFANDIPALPAPPVFNIFGELPGQPAHLPVSEALPGAQQHTFVTEGYDSAVAGCPRGQWLAFASTRHSERTKIYLPRTTGVSVMQITTGPADDSFPAFSPDGNRIAFASTRNGSWDIYVMDIDGRNIVQVTSGPAQDVHPSFSPDGRRLVYSSLSPRSGEWELWVVDLATGQKQMIGPGLFPSWSPRKDKDVIAFQRPRARGSRWFSLWSCELIGGEPRMVTEVAVSTNAAIVSPSWSPDGARLAFATIVEPARMNGPKPLGQQDIWVINADGTNRQRLTDGRGSNVSPFWGADNRIYFISDRSGTECVWSVRAPAGLTATAVVE
jgi:beta propeller repeat protein